MKEVPTRITEDGIVYLKCPYFKDKTQTVPCEYKAKATHLTNMQNHVRVHTGDMPWKCHICPKKFRAKNNLYDHIKRHNPNNRPFNCPVKDCNRGYYRLHELRTH
jgi:KRAB domain-containing zinc finger protein